MPFTRRSLLKFFAATPLLFSPACSVLSSKKLPNAGNDAKKLGHLSILQGPTSATEALINVFSPRLKNYEYSVSASDGSVPQAELYATVEGPAHFKIIKLLVSGIKPGVEYKLSIVDARKGSRYLVDERTFKALETSNNQPRFALLSCMADDAHYEPVIDPIWERLRRENPDFIILNGDAVYVDAFEFVNKDEATELDLWQRYIDTFRRIPMYHWRELKPIFATWDDHDFGTNDGDREFKSREAAKRLYLAVFSGRALGDTWLPGPVGITSSLHAFGQRFFFMDDRSFRQPNAHQKTKEVYGHWGQTQHEWLMGQLSKATTPVWIVNGNQFFSAKAEGLKEAFQTNHPAEFSKFLTDLKRVEVPFVFASGDVHFSEVMQIPADRVGFETYELTSSCMHSTNDKKWENPLRLPGAVTNEFNFMMITSSPGPRALRIKTSAIGIADHPYFERELIVSRG